MAPPLIVVEGPPASIDAALKEVKADGWDPVPGWDLPRARASPDHRVLLYGQVNTSEEAGQAVLAAVWGAAVLVHAGAGRDVIDRLCEDLRRLGPLDHRIGDRRGPGLTDEESAILDLLGQGVAVTDAARRLHLSRRTAVRRLESARLKLGATSNAEALLVHRRSGR